MRSATVIAFLQNLAKVIELNAHIFGQFTYYFILFYFFLKLFSFACKNMSSLALPYHCEMLLIANNAAGNYPCVIPSLVTYILARKTRSRL